jgi:NADPH2:quinone reductase
VSGLVYQDWYTVKALSSLITAVGNLSKLHKAMRALRIHKFGGPDNLKLEDIPIPSVGNSEILVRVHAAGINPVDTYIREGAYALLPKLPAILGKEIAGRVEDVGEGVSSVKVFKNKWILLEMY